MPVVCGEGRIGFPPSREVVGPSGAYDGFSANAENPFSSYSLRLKHVVPAQAGTQYCLTCHVYH